MRFIYFAVTITLLLSPILAEDNLDTDITLVHRWSLDEDENGLLQISIDSEEEIAGLQFTLQFNDPNIFLGTPIAELSNDHIFFKSKADSNELKVIGFSMEGKSLDLETPILSIPMLSSKAREKSVKLIGKDMVASSPKGQNQFTSF